jgi:predicted dehydrogenase
MTTIRAGIAGAGMVAAVHADAIRRAGGTVVGVAASTPERSKAAAQRLGADRAFATAEELATADDVDVVHVCTPNALHGPLVRAALAAGKHVVCEKPLSLSGTDSDELTALAASSGLVAAVPLVYRYHPMAVEARERVRAGDLGAIRLIHGHYLQDWLARPEDNNWRVDPAVGGASRAFADIGSHWCDLVEWVSGHRISELIAATQTVLPQRSAAGRETFTASGTPAGTASEGGVDTGVTVTTEDAVQVLFRTDRGATGALVVSQVSPGRKNRLWFEIDGADRSVSFDGEDPETLLLGGRDRTEIVRRDNLSPAADRINAVPAGHPWGYRDCFAAFTADVYAAVADPALRGADSEGPAHPAYPAFIDAARTAHITDAVLASAAHRSWIEVS